MPTKTRAAGEQDETTPTPDPVANAQATLEAEQRRLDALEHELRVGLPFRQRENRAKVHAATMQARVDLLEELDEERRALIERNNALIDERSAQEDRVNAARAALTEARKGPLLPVEEAERLVAAARAELDGLETEQRVTPGVIESAMRTGDTATLATARTRAEVLPTLIVSARIGLLNAEAKHAEAMAVASPGRIGEAYDAIAPLQEELGRMQTAIAEATAEWGRRRVEQSEWKRRAADKRREADELLSEQARREAAPVVRSLRHTVRAGA